MEHATNLQLRAVGLRMGTFPGYRPHLGETPPTSEASCPARFCTAARGEVAAAGPDEGDQETVSRRELRRGPSARGAASSVGAARGIVGLWTAGWA